MHRTARSLLLWYVGHRDAAYRWAERRRLEAHAKTGAAQLVEVRETVPEIEIPRYVPSRASAGAVAAKPPIFERIPDDDLLG